MFINVLSYKEVVNEEIKNKLMRNKIKEQKAYVIRLNTDYESIKKCFDDDYYVQFYVLNDNDKVVKILNQDEVKTVFKNHFKQLNFK